MAIRPQSELVTDRTSQDVQRELTKGHLNVEDLNRIGEWQIYIRDLLNEYGYYVNITPKTDFVKSDLTNMTTKITKIKNDLQSLKDAYYVLSTTPDVPSTDRLAINYVELNDIEKILSDIEYLIESMSKYFVYSGVAVSGQSHLWQNRFRRY